MNEEIEQYHELIQNLKEESKYLRRGEVEPLIRIVRSIEEKVDHIWKIEKNVKKIIQEIDQNSYCEGDSPSFLKNYSNISGEQRIMLKQLRKRLNQSKEMVKRINELNKQFAHEYLFFLSEIISYFVSPNSEKFFYNRPGRKRTTSSTLVSINREV